MSFNPAPKPQPREKRKPRPIRAKNPVNAADTFARCYGSEARVEWVQSLPCVVEHCARGRSENAHVEGGGAGRKADANKIVPLCKTHHGELHRMGVEEFEGTYYVDLAALALDTERCWRRFAGTTHTTEGTQ